MDRRRDDRDVESSLTQYPAQHRDGCLAQRTWPGTALRNGSGDKFHSSAGGFLFRFRILAQSVGNHMVLRTDRALALTPRTGRGFQRNLAHRAPRNTNFQCLIESRDLGKRGSGGRAWWDGSGGQTESKVLEPGCDSTQPFAYGHLAGVRVCGKLRNPSPSVTRPNG